MLTTLSIENVALIGKLEVEFGRGLNILSGETGAGKSIIIDSVNFVLGTRADKTLIRYGQKSARVSAYFDEITPDIKQLLEEYGIEDEGELMISRTMSEDGAGVCRINGRKVTLNMLKGLSSLLADIYGQHESVSLLNPSNHLGIVDAFAGDKLQKVLEMQSKLCAEYYGYKSEIAEYQKLAGEDREYLDFKINEIEEAALQPGEEEELLAARRKLNNYEAYLTALQTAAEEIDGEDGAVERISAGIKELSRIADYEPSLSSLNDRLEAVNIELDDITSELRSLLDDSDFDAERAKYVEERIAKINLLKRKYGASIDEILGELDELKDKASKYDVAVAECEKFDKKIAEMTDKLYDNTLKISDIRQKAAKNFSEMVTKELASLGMKNAKFTVEFAKIAKKEELSFSPSGSDEVAFLFSANSGQPPRPLSKIISGGELSRFMLAMKNCLPSGLGIQTMIFDEIDTGISGETAQIVAEKLYNISRGKQVLAVTHLPQLAAMADKQFLIAKTVQEGNTYTTLTDLDREGMLAEISRLIGGSQYSKHALLHATEMKDHADEYKKSLF